MAQFAIRPCWKHQPSAGLCHFKNSSLQTDCPQTPEKHPKAWMKNEPQVFSGIHKGIGEK